MRSRTRNRNRKLIKRRIRRNPFRNRPSKKILPRKTIKNISIKREKIIALRLQRHNPMIRRTVRKVSITMASIKSILRIIPWIQGKLTPRLKTMTTFLLRKEATKRTIHRSLKP
jgi:hypothetical protein